MVDVVVVITVVLGLAVVGAVIYIPVRWWVRRNIDHATRNDKVTGWDLLKIGPIVGLFLVLAWFKESGNEVAIVAFGLLMIGTSIYAAIVSYRARKRNEHDDT